MESEVLMSEDPKKSADSTPLDQLDELDIDVSQLSAKERFTKTAHIAMLMAYDLIDKMRYLEKETLELPDEQIEARLEHLRTSIDQLRTAYLTFSDADL